MEMLSTKLWVIILFDTYSVFSLRLPTLPRRQSVPIVPTAPLTIEMPDHPGHDLAVWPRVMVVISLPFRLPTSTWTSRRARRGRDIFDIVSSMADIAVDESSVGSRVCLFG